MKPVTTKSTSWLEGYHQALLDAANECERIFKEAPNKTPFYKQNAIGIGCLTCAKAIRAMKDTGL